VAFNVLIAPGMTHSAVSSSFERSSYADTSLLYAATDARVSACIDSRLRRYVGGQPGWTLGTLLASAWLVFRAVTLNKGTAVEALLGRCSEADS